MTLSAIPADSQSMCEVCAKPNKTGFFGLSQLHEFSRTVVDPHVDSADQATLIMDFSRVRVWDIAALLWLVVALHYYRHNAGLSYLLRLPEGTDAMSEGDRDAFDKSADYLRRWNFSAGLANIVPDVDSILVKEQKGYFSEDTPRRFYLDRKALDDRGLLQSLISRRLVGIRNLADPMFPGPRAVTSDHITDCVTRFQSERIGDILYSQCRIDKRTGDLFSDHLLTEALMNVQEHPNATIGMVAISVVGGSKELVLSVVDNGDPIPQTIFERYRRDHEPKGVLDPSVPSTYDRIAMHGELKAKVVDYAMQPGVTRKTGLEEQNAGMGLTYIKKDTLDTFHGKLRVVTDSLCLRYSGSSEDEPEKDDWPHKWSGNLLRIAIPLSACEIA